MSDDRPVLQAVLRGVRGRCPHCGIGGIFHRFLKVRDTCPHCGQELFHHRADDAPPYVVIFIVGHVVVTGMLWAEVAYEPALWIHAAVWLPITTLMCLLLLQPAKGALIGLQWAWRMHGFETAPEPNA